MPSPELSIGTGARTVFGAGCVSGLAAAVRRLGGERAFLVTDRGLAAGGLGGLLGGRLCEAGLDVAVFSDLGPNPDCEDVATGARALSEFGTAVVIGLGGGTALDCAKAISLAAANDLPVVELDYRNQRLQPGLPVVAVPTTAGTGSETNAFAVIEDRRTRRKLYLGNASVAPREVLLDPALTTGLPAAQTAATGIDALVHALESILARHPNPYAHGLATQVVRTVHAWLPRAMAAGDDLEARAQLLLAAHMAGLAFATTGLGLCHALAHALSALLGTTHGVALAVVLAPVLELDLAVRPAQLAELGRLLDLAEPEMGEGEAAAAAVAGIRDLAGRVGMPATLGEIGASRELVPEVARRALDDVVLANSPMQPARERLEEILEELL